MLLEETMLLQCFIQNENWLKFQGPSPEQTDRKVLGQGPMFDPRNIMPQILIKDSGNLKDKVMQIM